MKTPAFLSAAKARLNTLQQQARVLPGQVLSRVKTLTKRSATVAKVVAPGTTKTPVQPPILQTPRAPGTHGIWGGNSRAAKAAQALSAAYAEAHPVATATAVADPSVTLPAPMAVPTSSVQVSPAEVGGARNAAEALSANSSDLVEALKAMGIAAQPAMPGAQGAGHGVWDGKHGVPLFLVVPEDFIAASRQATEQRRARPFVPRRRRTKTAQERLDQEAAVPEIAHDISTEPTVEIAPEDVATVDDVAEVHEKVSDISERLEDLEQLLASHPLPPAVEPVTAAPAPLVAEAPAATTLTPQAVVEPLAESSKPVVEQSTEPVTPEEELKVEAAPKVEEPVAELPEPEVAAEPEPEPEPEPEMVKRYRAPQAEPKHVLKAAPEPLAEPEVADEDEDDGLAVEAVPSAKTKEPTALRTKIVLVDTPVVERKKPEKSKEAKKPEAKKETKPEPEAPPMDIIYKPRPTRKVSAFQEFMASLKYFGLGGARSSFVVNLATMLDAGLPLVDALRTQLTETKNKAMKSIIQEITDSVEAGSPLWRAMDDLHFFSPHAIALVRIGEEAGNMAENMGYLAAQQEKDANLKGKIQMAMMYPSIVLTLMFFIVVGLGMFVLPQLISVLFSLNAKLPMVTLWVIAFTNFFTQYGAIAVPGFLFGVFVYATLSKFTKLKIVTQWIIFHSPGVGKLMRQATIARFGVIVGGLMQAGVPLVDALISLVEVTPIVSYKNFYQRLLDHICNGDTFSKSFTAIKGSEKFIPTSMQQLIVTGERSGALAKIMMKVSEIYEKEANNTAEKLPVILEPVILLVIGGLVGTIAFAIIIPIYSVVGNIGH